jgi:hypothetical protein
MKLCGDSSLCCALQQLISLVVLMVLMDPGLSAPPILSSVDSQLKGMLYICQVYSSHSHFSCGKENCHC